MAEAGRFGVLKLSVIATSLVLIFCSAALAQTAETGAYTDACHVYIIDVKVAEKAFDEFINSKSEQAAEKAMSKGVMIVGEFAAKIGEEETTTKVYTFPGSAKKITASVFYTDEMMASENGFESILLGIVVSDKAQGDALSVENNALAEFTYTAHTGKVRAKKYVAVNGRSYLVGLECDCGAKNEPKKPALH